jgi:putative tryptophan/tyrosine transport system substrate-binding protein
MESAYLGLRDTLAPQFQARFVTVCDPKQSSPPSHSCGAAYLSAEHGHLILWFRINEDQKGAGVRRRDFISVIGGSAVWPLVVHAQSTNTARVVVLWPGASAPQSPRLESFAQGLRGSGYTEGINLTIELLYSEKGTEPLRDIAFQAAKRGTDVIATFGDLATRAAQEATKTVPIVATAEDMIGANLVSNLSQPDGNTTGLTLLSAEMTVKRLEIVKELLPGMSRVSALWDASAGQLQLKSAEEAARTLNLKLHVIEIRRRDEIKAALQAALESHPEALCLFSSPLLASLYEPIVEFAAANRLPVVYQWKDHVAAGGLISYGLSLAAVWRHFGVLVAKVLNGAKPQDVPIEQPARFELVVNLTTAAALSLTLPPVILVRADEVIE